MNKIKKMEIQPPLMLRWLFPGTLWRGEARRKYVHLTFDDGPIPKVTPAVLDILNNYGVKATFFCVADNVRKYPEVFDMLKQNGMGIGNHSYSHIKAFSNSKSDYFADVHKARELIPGDLFRPPYGQLFPWYVKKLRREFRKIIMWDVLSRDYCADLTDEDVFNNVLNFVRPGSIIVFHDSLKAWPRLETALPRVLKHLSDEGYSFELL